MKKLLFISMSLFVFAACSNNNDNADANNNAPEVENNEIDNANDAQAEDHNEAPNNDVETEGNNEDGSAVNNEHLQEYEEYDVLQEELDLDVYEGVVESDNKGTRIILFQTADGVKEYKSIFVKKKNRLKIVHFDDEDDLLFNDVID